MRDLPTCADLPDDYRPVARTPGPALFQRPDSVVFADDAVSLTAEEGAAFPSFEEERKVQPAHEAESPPQKKDSAASEESAGSAPDRFAALSSGASRAPSDDSRRTAAAEQLDDAYKLSKRANEETASPRLPADDAPAESAAGRSVTGKPESGTVHLVTPRSEAAWRTPSARPAAGRTTAQVKAPETAAPRNNGCWQCS